MNLDELEAKARAAKEALEVWHQVDVASYPKAAKATLDRSYDAMHDLHRLCDPDTGLDLIERVRAGEALRHENEEDRRIYNAELARAREERDEALVIGRMLLQELAEVTADTEPTDATRAAVGRWESLAHSPQEAI